MRAYKMYLYILFFVVANLLDHPSNVNSAAVLDSGKSCLLVDGETFCKKKFENERFAECRSQSNLRTALQDACAWKYVSCTSEDPTDCACEVIDQCAQFCVSIGITSLKQWRGPDFCPLKCTGGRVHMACAPKEDRTCGVTKSIDNSTCEEGCYCPSGTILYNDTCIEEENCPCQLNGKEYKSGSKVAKNCNTCICNKTKWECSEFSCNSSCSALGDPHYTSFDGKKFDFMGNCSYYLVKTNDFEVIGENGAWSAGSFVPYRRGLPTSTKSVTINAKGHVVKIDQGRIVTVDDVLVTSLPHTFSKITIYNPSANDVAVQLAKGVIVRYDGIYHAYITIPRSYRGKTKGLCGNYNDKLDDDFKTPRDVVVDSINEFGDSWKTEKSCPSTDIHAKHPCDMNKQNRAVAERDCKVLKSNIFSKCHQCVDPEVYYQNCVYDTCSCFGDLSACMCPMIKAYADACRSEEILIDWRNSTRCPINCSGGQTYNLCANTCHRTCRDITANLKCNTDCVEDCRCPAGQVLDCGGECTQIDQCSCSDEHKDYPAGERHIQFGEMCTCKSAKWKCKRRCDKENEIFYEDCNSCKCKNRQWSCTNEKCPTDGCIVRESNGTYPSIFITPGSVWKDGPCTNCTCVQNKSEFRLECKTKKCSNVNTDTKNFVYKNLASPEECCPRLERTACKHENNEYIEGQTWNIGVCIKERCIKKQNSELIKRQFNVTCNTLCDKGHVYEKSPNSCCGKCVQNACITGKEVRKVGEIWKSSDGCTTYTCEKIDGLFLVLSDKESCPNVSKCPRNKIYSDGCCNRCRTP